MAELKKRWRGGAASSDGFTNIGAKIELSKLKKAEPELDWRIASHPNMEGRFEIQGYQKEVASQVIIEDASFIQNIYHATMKTEPSINLTVGSPSLRMAVGEIIHRISKSLPDLREPIKMYLAGGVAVNFYTGYRATDDIDASFSHKIILPKASELVVSYDDENGMYKMVYFDMNYNPSFALMHPDFEKDALPVKGEEFQDEKIKLYILSPVDLALSKMSRFEGNDKEDIVELSKRNLFSPEALQARANEAFSFYIGNQAMLKMNLKDALEAMQVTHIKNSIENGR